MRKVNLLTSNGIPEALSNLYYGNHSSVVEIQDAVEDSKTAIDFVMNINKLDLMRKFKIDKETEDYVRLVSVDRLGNVSYLKAYK